MSEPTTFLGIMPIAFSYYAYFVNYFFIQYLVILAVCLFQAVVVLRWCSPSWDPMRLWRKSRE